MKTDNSTGTHDVLKRPVDSYGPMVVDILHTYFPMRYLYHINYLYKERTNACSGPIPATALTEETTSVQPKIGARALYAQQDPLTFPVSSVIEMTGVCGEYTGIGLIPVCKKNNNLPSDNML